MQHSLNVSIDAYIEFNTHFFLLAVWTRFVVVVVVFNTTLKKIWKLSTFACRHIICHQCCRQEITITCIYIGHSLEKKRCMKVDHTRTLYYMNEYRNENKCSRMLLS